MSIAKLKQKLKQQQKQKQKSEKRLSARVTADAVVLAGEGDEMSLLVVRRRYPPFAGEWALPGGFIDEGESPLSAAIRELREETGVSISAVSAIPLRSRGRVGRDPRGWTTSSPFLFHVKEESPLQVSDESTEVAWIKLSELKRLAFDHGAILCEALSLYWEQLTPQAPLLLKGKKGFKVPQSQRLGPLSEMTFFGGTFLPWHQGHRACLDLYLKSDKVKVDEKEIVVIPDKNPFKNHLPLSPDDLTSPFCAWEYYHDLQQKLEGPSCFVYPGFCGLEFVNPTYYWLRLLSVNNTNADGMVTPCVSLLMGDDSFISLPTWIESEKLIKLIRNIWVVPRIENKNGIESSEKWVLEQSSKTAIYYLPGHPYQDFSSTKLRQN